MIILVNEYVKCFEGKVLLLCVNFFEVYNQLVLLEWLVQFMIVAISEIVEIYFMVIIEFNVVIGYYVKIGVYIFVQFNVMISEYIYIGVYVEIQFGFVIGLDVFYFKKMEVGYQLWCFGGWVIIEDWVWIGVGCIINKGVFGDIIIGEGIKFDCQVYIGYDVVIGKYCLFVV